MDKAIEVEVLDFTGFDPFSTHVLININIGRMPPSRASDYLERTKNSLPLCKMLERNDITYSLIGCRSDGTKALEVAIEYKDDEVVSTTTDFDGAMKIVE